MKKFTTILAIAIFMTACTAMAGQPKQEQAKQKTQTTQPEVSDFAKSLAKQYQSLLADQKKAIADATAIKEFKAYTATPEFKRLQKINERMNKISELYNSEVGRGK